MNKFIQYLKGILSIKEEKNSTIIFILLLFVGFGLWGFVARGKFDSTISDMIIWLAGLVGGVNTANTYLNRNLATIDTSSTEIQDATTAQNDK
jgi:hypothetical protein